MDMNVEMVHKNELVYLACPYTNPNPRVCEDRFHAANQAAAAIMARGDIVFSPISHSHPISVDASVRTDWAFWQRFDRAILVHCRKIVVLKIEGWEDSVGVQEEIAFAREIGLCVEYIDPAPEVSAREPLFAKESS